MIYTQAREKHVTNFLFLDLLEILNHHHIPNLLFVAYLTLCRGLLVSWAKAWSGSSFQEFSFLFLNWKRAVLFDSFVWLRQDCWNREKKVQRSFFFYHAFFFSESTRRISALTWASLLAYPAVNVRILKWWNLSCRLLIAVIASRRFGQKTPEWLAESLNGNIFFDLFLRDSDEKITSAG